MCVYACVWVFFVVKIFFQPLFIISLAYFRSPASRLHSSGCVNTTLPRFNNPYISFMQVPLSRSRSLAQKYILQYGINAVRVHPTVPPH